MMENARYGIGASSGSGGGFGARAFGESSNGRLVFSWIWLLGSVGGGLAMSYCASASKSLTNLAVAVLGACLCGWSAVLAARCREEAIWDNFERGKQDKAGS